MIELEQELKEIKQLVETEKEKAEELKSTMRKNKVDHLKITKTQKEEINVITQILGDSQKKLALDTAQYKKQIN